jgi:aspartyl aminopeptidase
MLDAARPPGEPRRRVSACVFFDHEEVGSGSSRGAQSAFLRDVLERGVLRAAAGARSYHARRGPTRARLGGHVARHTSQLSEKHEPEHPVRMNGGRP